MGEEMLAAKHIAKNAGVKWFLAVLDTFNCYFPCLVEEFFQAVRG